MNAVRQKRVAIIHCNSKDQRNFITKRGLGAETWELSATAIRKHGMDFAVHFPVLDANNLPDARDNDGVIIPGSIFTPKEETFERIEWMSRLGEFIRNVIEAERPLLGICFGHEALGAAHGVFPVDFNEETVAEAGFHRIRLTAEGRKDPLFEGIGDEFMGVLIHYAYLPSVPGGAVQLAEGDCCRLQAFRLNDAVWGVQFHPDYGRQNMLQLVHKEWPKWPESFQRRELNLREDEGDNLRVMDNFLRFVKRS